MKKLSWSLTMYICTFMAVFCVMTLKAEAANVTTGTIGVRDSIAWTYDEDTKTLTLTGDGELETVKWSGEGSEAIRHICPDVEIIKVKNCKLSECKSMFTELSCVKSITFENFDTSQVTDMRWMFAFCEKLESVDVSGFDTTNVTTMCCMFEYCESLESVDVSDFNTANVTDLSWMFAGCKSMTDVDLTGFDTSKVTDMGYLFYSCSSLTALNLNSFDTTNVTNMEKMFYKCESLTDLDLSNFVLEELQDWTNMLNYCGSLEIIKTPKNILENNVDIKLPGTFVDPNQKQTTAINQNFRNTTLVNINNLVTRVSVTPASVDLKPGDMKQLQAFVAPKNAALKNVTWKSSDTAVATVDASGKVMAVSHGTATITAVANDGSGKSATCHVTVTEPMSMQERQVRAFVERMYTVALGRASEPSGIDYWTEELLSHRKDGAAISVGFIMSDEFNAKNYSDEAYLKVLYRTFFDREADADGLSFWLKEMKAGRSRKSVLAGFVNSKEFTQVCESYGITRGTMADDATATGAGQFVERLYSIALERPSDPVGLDDWAKRINNKTNTPEQVAKEFFLSPEYAGKKTSNEKYVETLYLVFMDRTSEKDGKAYWVEQLNQGVSRESVLEGFADSEEFKEIMARYGL